MGTGITELAIVIFIAAALGILAKLLKQPTILAYLATGVVIGYFGFFNFDNHEIFQVFSDLGIMFLLFLVGLEINYASLRLVGKPSLLIGFGQILFTATFGFIVSHFLGFATIEALYIAIALTFSSTIIIVQLLSERKAMNSLYGKLSIGFLLVQDFVAIIILLLLAGIESGGSLVVGDAVLIVVEGMALFAVMLFLGRKIFPPIFNKIAHSRELLFLSSLAWLFSLVAVVEYIGFSIEIGGFLAGLALANSSEHFEISSKIKPLRDFFILIFFAILGSSVVFSSFSGLGLPIILLSLFVLIGNPLIVLIIMGLLGYEKRTSFLSGITVAQISEFSLIVAAMGLRLGHINGEILALITAVGVVTITVSTYLIVYADEIFKILAPYLSFFEKKNKKDMFIPGDDFRKPIILIGFHRTGKSIAYNLDKKDLLIVDFDPTVIKSLEEKGYTSIFGDISDFEILDKIEFLEARLVISTTPNLQDNLSLLSVVCEKAKKKDDDCPKVVVRADNLRGAEILYEAGADYVLMPQFISGHYLSRVLDTNNNLEILDELKKRDIKVIKKEDKL